MHNPWYKTPLQERAELAEMERQFVRDVWRCCHPEMPQSIMLAKLARRGWLRSECEWRALIWLAQNGLIEGGSNDHGR
jgi:hypothetical protein